MAKLNRESPATYKWIAYGAVATGLFASVSDNGSVTIALPTIADHFETDLPTAQWVIIADALTISASVIPRCSTRVRAGGPSRAKTRYFPAFGPLRCGGPRRQP